ncbi:chemotaxis protein CheW [Marinobacteraceae bacterium S3BR75-40.1]
MAQDLIRLDDHHGAAAQGTAGQYLSFHTKGERFALPIAQVREIIEYPRVTPVPMVPDHILGIINLRGQGVPVIDLACRFGRGATAIGKRTCIIVLDLPTSMGALRLGLAVDAVDAVFQLDAADVEPAPQLGAGMRTDFLAGMLRGEQGFTLLLALAQLLSVAELQQLKHTPEDWPSDDE